MKSPLFFRKLRSPKKQWPLVIRRVHGHSMVPVLPPGTTVYGWRRSRLRLNDVIIFEREGREMIKRIESLTSDGVFVLGDHAETSTDSRHFGLIPQSSIVARVIWPKAKKQSV